MPGLYAALPAHGMIMVGQIGSSRLVMIPPSPSGLISNRKG